MTNPFKLLDQEHTMASPTSVFMLSPRNTRGWSKRSFSPPDEDSSCTTSSAESPRKSFQELKDRFHSPVILNNQRNLAGRSGLPPPPLTVAGIKQNNVVNRMNNSNKTTLKGIVSHSPITPPPSPKKKIALALASAKLPLSNPLEGNCEESPWPRGGVNHNTPKESGIVTLRHQAKSNPSPRYLNSPRVVLSPGKAAHFKNQRQLSIPAIEATLTPLKSAFLQRPSSTPLVSKRVRFDSCSTRVFDKHLAPRAISRTSTRRMSLNNPSPRRSTPTREGSESSPIKASFSPVVAPHRPSRFTPPPPPPLVGCRNPHTNQDAKILETLLQSKVFATRLDRKVTKIQASARGYMQRFRYAERQAQAAEERRAELARIGQRRQCHAATALQAWVRGVKGRRQALLRQLERRLDRIQYQHRRELQEIAADLARRKSEWRQSYEASLRRQEQQRKAQVGAQLRGIRQLQAENKNLRLSNKKIRRQGEELHETNHQLELQTAALEIEVSKAKELIADLERQNEKWANVDELYRTQVEKFEWAHEDLEGMIGMEKRTNMLLQSTMVQVLETMESAQREDPEEAVLFQTTLAMAAQAPWSGKSSHLPLLLDQAFCLDLEHSSGDFVCACSQ